MDGIFVTSLSIIQVSTRTFNMGDVTRALAEDRVMEMFGCGTACVVAPIQSILYQGNKLEIPTMNHELPLWNKLYTQLTDIQYGRVIKKEWTNPVHLSQADSVVTSFAT